MGEQDQAVEFGAEVSRAGEIRSESGLVDVYTERPSKKRVRTPGQEHDHYLKRKARVGTVHPYVKGTYQPKPSKDRRFLCYDGEGSADAYWLLGNEDEYIYKAEGLTTLECLEFLTKGEADGCIRIYYGIHYDVNQLVRDVPKAKQTLLFRGEWVEYGIYSLRYYPHHRLEITTPGRRWQFDDVSNYFRAPLIDVAERMGLEVPSVVKHGKASRSNLREFAEVDLWNYTRAECRLTRLVMEHFRASLQWPADDVLPNITPTSWMGPGSVASALLRKLPDFRPAREFRGGGMESAWVGGYPVEVQQAAERAFFGGRVELFKIGHSSPIYVYDLNSAYPSAMRELWVGGRWRKLREGESKFRGSTTVIDAEWDLTGTGVTVGPLPWRDKDGGVNFPAIGRGWYWNNEVFAAASYHADNITLHGAYGLMDAEIGPLGPIVERLYALRQQFKAQGDPRELGVKAALVALYGKLCQHHGDAKWRNLAMAGWVTASVRATMLRAMMQAPDKIVACLTDSIHSTVPLTLDIGPGLGQWTERKVESGDYLLHSIYRHQGGSIERGDERTGGLQVSGLPWETVLHQIEQNGRAEVYAGMFVGHTLANSSRLYAPYRLQFLGKESNEPIQKRVIDPFGELRREVDRVPKHPRLGEQSYATTPLYSLPGEEAHTIVPSYPPGGFDDRREDEEVEEYVL